MRKLTRFLGLIGLVCAATGVQADSISIGPSRDNTRLCLAVGDRLTITLPANPATGASWHIDVIDKKILALVGKPVYLPKGLMVFTFKAVGLGRVGQQMSYHRPREKPAPDKLFTLLVRVVVAESHKKVIVTDAENNEQKQLVFGETLEVRLPVDARSGGVWSVTVPTCLRQVGQSQYVPLGAAPKTKANGWPLPTLVSRARSGGEQVFRFRVAHGGFDILQFLYRKPGNPPTKTYRLPLMIPRPWSGVSPLE